MYHLTIPRVAPVLVMKDHHHDPACRAKAYFTKGLAFPYLFLFRSVGNVRLEAVIPKEVIRAQMAPGGEEGEIEPRRR